MTNTKITEALLYVELTEVAGRTLQDMLHNLQGMLRVDGPRALTAQSKNGAVVHASLYYGEDYIMDATGRLIYHLEV